MLHRSDNLIAGLMFLAIAALFGFTALKTLDIGTVGEMGPGFFPIMISVVLAILGLLVMFSRSETDNEERRPIPWRAVLLVTLAPIAFAYTVRSLGLVPALIVSVAIGVAASHRIGWKQGALIVVGMTAFCVAVFSYGIGLTAQLFVWPPQPY